VIRRSGAVLTVLAIAGLAAAIYLAATKLLGEPPVCGPIKGCEDVAASQYSTVAGIPVALFGVGYSIVLIGLSAIWWRLADRRALLGAYALGLLGCFVVAGLTYLELFVIHAICIYCVAYGLTIIAGFIIAAVTLRGTGSPESSD
jgi:uncharacterized membrane protein